MAKVDIPGYIHASQSLITCVECVEGLTHFNYHASQVGLKGEARNLNSLEGISSVEWMQGLSAIKQQQPLTWYKVKVNSRMNLRSICNY